MYQISFILSMFINVIDDHKSYYTSIINLNNDLSLIDIKSVFGSSETLSIEKN